MTLQVRRVVTGHDADGKAVVATDEVMTGGSMPTRPYISRCEIWSTDSMPVDNSEGAAADAQRAGFVKRYNYVGNGQGTVVRITEFAPSLTIGGSVSRKGHIALALADSKPAGICRVRMKDRQAEKPLPLSVMQSGENVSQPIPAS